MPPTSDLAILSPWQLALEPQSDSCLKAVLAGPGGRPVSVSFVGLTRPLNPVEQLDGFMAAMLPALVRAHGDVHVVGTITREIVRNLMDASKGWEDWNADRYQAFRISADRIIDPPVPSFTPQAAFAWSGSLRSTHTLVRHLAHRVPGAVRVARIIHVIGLQGDMQNIPSAAISAEVNVHAEKLGATAACVITNAREAELVEAEMGVLPVVAAALHLTATDLKLAFHARRWPLTAQLRFPRPEPVFPDIYSGSRLTIRADGGATTPTQMVRDIRDHAPSLLPAINGCSERPRFTTPCGVCSGCIITTLAFAAAGTSHEALPPPNAISVQRLHWNDPAVTAEATEIVSDWSSPKSGVYRALRRRLTQDRISSARLDVSRWLASATGRGPIWPR